MIIIQFRGGEIISWKRWPKKPTAIPNPDWSLTTGQVK